MNNQQHHIYTANRCHRKCIFYKVHELHVTEMRNPWKKTTHPKSSSGIFHDEVKGPLSAASTSKAAAFLRTSPPWWWQFFLQIFDEFLEAIIPSLNKHPLLLGNLFVLAPRVGEFLETWVLDLLIFFLSFKRGLTLHHTQKSHFC